MFLGVMGMINALPAVWAADPELESRLGRLERIIENQSGSELLLQIQRLQGEMQTLRGMIERQGLEIDQLKRQQRDQFLDLDTRLRSRDHAAETGVMPSETGSAEALQPGSGSVPELPAAPAEPVAPNLGGIPALPQPETRRSDERALYTQAFQLVKDRRYQEARGALSEFLRRYPEGNYAESAHYWLAETQYTLRDYPAALTEYERFIQRYPTSAKVPGALLKIGLIQVEQGQSEQARATLERLIRDHPEAPESRLARDRLGRLEGRAR